MRSPPPHLWREWSAQSHGLNSPTCFAPASTLPPFPTATASKPTTTNTIPRITATELKSVLAGRHDPANRFLFFSDTLTFSLQFAAQKKARGLVGNRITYLDTATARDESGKKAVFHHVPDLIKMTGMKMEKNREQGVIDYAGEWVALDCNIYAGMGSSTVSFDVLLERGLYSVSPELGLQAERRNVHLYSALKTIRRFCFESGRVWEVTGDVMAVAVRLSAAFEGVGGSGEVEVGQLVQKRLVAWFLAMRRREEGFTTVVQRRLGKTEGARSGLRTGNLSGTTEKELKGAGIKRTFSEVIDLIGEDDDEEAVQPARKRMLFPTSTPPSRNPFTTNIAAQTSFIAAPKTQFANGGAPEIMQYEALMSILENAEIRLQASDLSKKISQSTIAKDREKWQSWFRASRAQDRESWGGGRGRELGPRGARRGVVGARLEKKKRHGGLRTGGKSSCQVLEHGVRGSPHGSARRFHEDGGRGGSRQRRY